MDNEIEIIDLSGYKPRKIPPPKWRECIKKIWGGDPLQCPPCKGEMKIISFINERPVIRKILDHLKLWDKEQRRRPSPSRAGPQLPVWKRQPVPEEPQHQELFDDGRPSYEESHITDD